MRARSPKFMKRLNIGNKKERRVTRALNLCLLGTNDSNMLHNINNRGIVAIGKIERLFSSLLNTLPCKRHVVVLVE